jgi:hypothetical protein
MKIYDVIIIGGGASGLVAAIEAKKQYKNVAVIEKEQRVGKKILATGNGKCNMTNINANIKNYNGSFSYCIKKLYNEFSPQYIRDCFKNMGLYSVSDNMGRVYPTCKQASAVVDILRNALRMNDIEEITNEKVKDIKVEEHFTVITENSEFYCKKLIIATGGKSSPRLGSDGSMYKILENIGHTITKLKPALCPIRVNSDILKSIKGVRANGKITVLIKGKAVKSSEGEIQFTDNSISGICAFDLSGLDFDVVRVSLMPEYTVVEILDILKERRKIFYYNNIDEFFLGMFNNKLSIAILKYGKMGSFNRKCNDISDKELYRLAEIINNFEFKAQGNNSYDHSQVTKGGILGKEINEDTFESMFIPNLYFCGEVIDIDGICGGYNLQFAFASGMKAGQLQ